MMKVTILTQFRDKDNHKVIHVPGEIKEFDDARAESLIKRGLVSPLDNSGDKADDAENPAPKSKGKKGGKSSKKKDETPALTGDATTDNADDEEAQETESETTIPDKDKQ